MSCRQGVRAGAVGPTPGQVDHRRAVDHDAHGGADLTALGEVADELLPHGSETGVTVAGHGDVHRVTLSRAGRRRKRSRTTDDRRPTTDDRRPTTELHRPAPSVRRFDRVRQPPVAPARRETSRKRGDPAGQVADHQALDLAAVVGPAQRHGVGRPGAGQEGAASVLGQRAALASAARPRCRSVSTPP